MQKSAKERKKERKPSNIMCCFRSFGSLSLACLVLLLVRSEMIIDVMDVMHISSTQKDEQHKSSGDSVEFSGKSIRCGPNCMSRVLTFALAIKYG